MISLLPISVVSLLNDFVYLQPWPFSCSTHTGTHAVALMWWRSYGVGKIWNEHWQCSLNMKHFPSNSMLYILQWENKYKIIRHSVKGDHQQLPNLISVISLIMFHIDNKRNSYFDNFNSSEWFLTPEKLLYYPHLPVTARHATCPLLSDMLHVPYCQTCYLSLIVRHATCPLLPDMLHVPYYRHATCPLLPDLVLGNIKSLSLLVLLNDIRVGLICFFNCSHY